MITTCGHPVQTKYTVLCKVVRTFCGGYQHSELIMGYSEQLKVNLSFISLKIAVIYSETYLVDKKANCSYSICYVLKWLYMNFHAFVTKCTLLLKSYP